MPPPGSLHFNLPPGCAGANMTNATGLSRVGLRAVTLPNTAATSPRIVEREPARNPNDRTRNQDEARGPGRV
jgi:hypothetical protein